MFSLLEAISFQALRSGQRSVSLNRTLLRPAERSCSFNRGSMMGVGPPAPAHESTKVYSAVLDKPPSSCTRILDACKAGDPFLEVEVFQARASALCVCVRRNSGHHDWSSISAR